MKLLRVGLCVLLVFTVLSFGGVQVWSQSIFEIAAALLFLFWALIAYRNPAAKIQWTPLNWPLLGFVAIGLLQLLFHETAYSFATRTQLLKLAAYFLFFFLIAQAFRTRDDLTKLAWFLILFGFVISLLAIAQHFTSGGEIYWIPALQVHGDPFGPYVDRDHFAGFVELTVPTGLALMAFRGVRRELLVLATLLTLVPISAIVLSGSRGGIIGFALELATLAALARSQGALQGQRVAAAALVALVALILVAWVGASFAVQKFSAVRPGDLLLSRRVSMLRGAAHIFLDHPIIGCGLGTLVSVYPRYETAYDKRIVDHVHDDYFETLAETGILGGLFGLSFLWSLFRQGQRNFAAEQGHFSKGLHAGAIAAVGGLLLHSFVDFNLQIPANAMLFLLQSWLVAVPPLASGSSPRSRRAPSAG
jgi:O-antigen ligase